MNALSHTRIMYIKESDNIFMMQNLDITMLLCFVATILLTTLQQPLALADLNIHENSLTFIKESVSMISYITYMRTSSFRVRFNTSVVRTQPNPNQTNPNHPNPHFVIINRQKS